MSGEWALPADEARHEDPSVDESAASYRLSLDLEERSSHLAFGSTDAPSHVTLGHADGAEDLD
jgi:hypothetical protein